MNSRIFWKLLLSFAVLAWSLYNLWPMSDADFPTYLVSRAAANQAELQKLVNQAQELTTQAKADEIAAKSGTETDAAKNEFIQRHRTFFLSLRSLCEDDKIDLWNKFYPNLLAGDIKNVNKRNGLILAQLLKDSKSRIKYGLDLKGGVGFTLSLDEKTLPDASANARNQALSKAVEIMDKRINAYGISEPVIRPLGDNSLEVQMPAVSTKENPDIINVIKKPAKLGFHTVARQSPQGLTPDQYPLGYSLMVEEDENKATGEPIERQYLVSTRPAAGGDILKSAGAYYDSTVGQYKVGMTFTTEGAEVMRALTSELVKQHDQLAIVLDGKLVSAPQVNGVISDHGEIEGGVGGFTQKEAVDLANVLNNPLAYELKVDEMTEVGPSLAKEALDSSIKAGLLGTALVVVFMCVIYKLPGFLSVVTLVLNVLMILGIQASLGATLTLPGVAALVLTIGMAVDANILIYERMREEMAQGKSLINSLEAGHDRALAAILDSHVTSIITAVILMWLGAGPVKGFGVILGIGLVANLFCVLVFNHALLELFIGKGWISKLRFLRILPEINVPFYSYRKPAIAASIVVILIGFAAIFSRGENALGPDFRGGEEISVHFAQPIPMADIDKTAASIGAPEALANYQKELGTGLETLKIQTSTGHGQVLLEALAKAYPDAKLDVANASVAVFGATVSDSLKANALLALVLALLGVMLYVAFRFEVGYAIGAMVATLHDVVITVGIYVLLGGQFTAAMVAAVLMILGYSLNDKVIVFDRVREELKNNPHLRLVQVLDLAVNRTFARTVMTSLTTFLAAFALFVYGAGVVHDFALIFMLGIVAATDSSIFIACPVFCWWHKGDRRHVEEREFMPKYEWDSSTRGA